MQLRSHSIAQDNVDLEDTWFNPYLDEDTSKIPSHKPSIAPDNNNKMLTLLQSKMHVQESTASKGEPASELHKHTATELLKKPKEKKFVLIKKVIQRAQWHAIS